eukprot:358504-Chlamydomonas_euryale.AAC.2
MLKSSDRICHDLETLKRLRRRAAPLAEPAGAEGTWVADAGVRATPADVQPSALSGIRAPPADVHPSARSGVAAAVSTAGPASGAVTEAGGAVAAGVAAAGVAAAGPAGGCVFPVLVLRKWYQLRPEREFRAFVSRGVLVGACQRDVSQHFPQLLGNGAVDGARAAISAFHARHLAGTFPLQDCECGARRLICRTVALSLCRPVALWLCRCADLWLCRSVALSLCRSVAVLIWRPVALSLSRCANLSICRCADLSLYRSVDLSRCSVAGPICCCANFGARSTRRSVALSLHCSVAVAICRCAHLCRSVVLSLCRCFDPSLCPSATGRMSFQDSRLA